MSRNRVPVTGVAVLLGLTLACTSKSSTPLTPTNPGTSGSSTTASDGSTLKVTPPVPQSPINDQKPATGPAKLVVSASTAPFVPVIAVKYRFQVFNAAGALVEDVVANSTSHDVERDLPVNNRFTWRARAEGIDVFGPWSTTASFIAPESAFLGVSEFADPLTNGRTVGVQRGGHFIPGQGWKADNENDGIDYDLQLPCVSCTLEWDATSFGKGEGEVVFKDLKWITMGDAAAFGSFGAFRDHPWKMHLEQRADGDGTGLKLIWRNGASGEDDPGDHTGKLGSAVDWESDEVFHFRLDWDEGGYSVEVNGVQWFSGGFEEPYAPPNHRVSLGCWPRSETMWALYRNVKLRKR